MNNIEGRQSTQHFFFLRLNWFRSGGGTGGTVAKDALGNDVIAVEWLKTHGPGDRTLTQGLKVTMKFCHLG